MVEMGGVLVRLELGSEVMKFCCGGLWKNDESE